MKRTPPMLASIVLALLSLLFVPRVFGQSWKNVGPFGGDARSFAFSSTAPSHILLGTTNGWIYQTSNGSQWTRLSKIAQSDALVVDHILFDEANPKRLLVGAWMLDRPDGGVFISDDDGHHWTPVPDMQGQSVRALAQAPSDPKIFVAGTLKGVYRSEDGGEHWSLISPPGSTELHEVESIAIDPVNPQDVYSGTWHLPWKTQDGGKSWQSIQQGMIVDSDVFSIIIDPHAPQTVYASACSGIYKSTDAGMQFHKIQGIPSAARRTRVLKQDPSNANVVYAGTTEGLYKTVDAGTKWVLMTPNDIIINDIYIDPRNSQHVLMATDRSGVLDSEDGGASFHSSNDGFSERQISSMVNDPRDSDTIYVGVVNDKRFGGVFASKDAGETWNQIGTGLEGRDVFALADSSQGALLAGTNRGIYRWNTDKWENVSNRLKARTRKVTHIRKRHRYVSIETTYVPDGKIDGSVRGVAFSDGEWYAATSDGVYSSDDSGFLWRGGPIQKSNTFTAISVSGDTVLAAGPSLLALSEDRAKTWHTLGLPSGWRRVRYVALDADGRLWVGGRLGVAFSEDHGQTWQTAGVPINDISGLQYEAQMKRILVTSYDSDLVFGIDNTTKHWMWWNPAWRVHAVVSSKGRLVAATLLHGVVVQPENQPPAGRF
ncbi:MAG: transcriptional regulator [Acidobacteriaceae bacterium]